METTTVMFGANIALSHEVSQQRCKDFLAEAERQRSLNLAVDGQARSRRATLAGVRASIASVLLRAGSWLMPAEVTGGCDSPASRAFELRAGQ